MYHAPMSDASVATTRTTVNSTVAALFALVLSNLFGWEISVSDPVYLALVGFGVPVFYRLSLWASAKWPTVGYVLFGTGKTPTYGQ